MISFDTTIVVYALNSAMSRHKKAYEFLESLADDDRIVISEQMLVEVYLFIRNASVFPYPSRLMKDAFACESFPLVKLHSHVFPWNTGDGAVSVNYFFPVIDNQSGIGCIFRELHPPPKRFHKIGIIG